MKPAKRQRTAREIERSIKYLLIEREQYDCIKPDGSLDEDFILSNLIQNNHHAALEYRKILLAYEKVKKHEIFTKVMQSRRVKEKTLKKIVLFHEAIVRPAKIEDNIGRSSIYSGEILKMPSDKAAEEYDAGEEWKALVEKESRYKVGDKVLYSFKSNIILDNELLHVVGCFTGKILN